MKQLNLIKKTGCCSDVNINEDDIAMDFINDMETVEVSDTTNHIIRVIESGSFVGKAIYLSCDYDYVIGLDSFGYTILVPLKKK